MIPRFAIALVLLAGLANAGSPGPIEGNYRFGHEVNIFCTGVPEACYWLVDTATDVRHQLRQEASTVAPYAPVCLRVVAEISDIKADGFGLDYDGSIRVHELLGRCGADTAAEPLRIEYLQHRRWELQRIDGIQLEDLARDLGFSGDEAVAKQPDLDFGEQGYVSGNTGCNQFQGQARVIDIELILSQLATTAMACVGFAAELELRLQLLYRNPLALALDGKYLVLRGAGQELRYHIRDWVQ